MGHRGKRFPSIHLYLALLGFGGSFTEFACRLMETGFEDYLRFVVINFELSDWGTHFHGGVDDGMGWRVLEMVDRVLRGFLLWIDSFEWIILFQIMLIVHFSISGEESGKKSFPAWWGYFGVVIGFISILDFVAEVLRLQNWVMWSVGAAAATFANRVIFLPLWLLVLSRRLPEAIEKVGFGTRDKDSSEEVDETPTEEQEQPT